MKQYLLTLLALVATMVLPAVATAADLPVSYTVQEKPLKTAVAGTNVTFDLYSDAVCTGPIVHTETVAIENVDIISRLKLGVPKGAPVKPPKTSELRHTLTGVTDSGNLFLKVTGIGVTAAGGACQAQASHVAEQAPQIPALPEVIRTSGGVWVFDVTYNGLSPANAAVALALTGLDVSKRYSCDVSVAPDPPFTMNPRPVYGVSNCIPLPASCTDNLKNQDETDVDCGGTVCPACSNIQICLVNGDCASATCLLVNQTIYFPPGTKLCYSPSCTNAVQDGLEVDIDCGAFYDCPPCGTGQMCTQNYHCSSAICTANICQP